MKWWPEKEFIKFINDKTYSWRKNNRICLLGWSVSALEASTNDSRGDKGLVPRQTKLSLSYCLVNTTICWAVPQKLWPANGQQKAMIFGGSNENENAWHLFFLFPSWLKPFGYGFISKPFWYELETEYLHYNRHSKIVRWSGNWPNSL